MPSTSFEDLSISWHGVNGSFDLDRYRRHDHGGGEDGDDWLDDHEIEADFRLGESTYKDYLKDFNKKLKRAGYEPNASFYLGEKGHFSIEFSLERRGRSRRR